LSLKIKSRTAILAVGCLVIAVTSPFWAEELQAQVYILFSPSVSIDICEADQSGVVHIGGKVGEDNRVGEAVFLSRGNRNQNVATVLGNGTFEGITQSGLAFPGQTLTIGIRAAGAEGTLMSACEVRKATGPVN